MSRDRNNGNNERDRNTGFRRKVVRSSAPPPLDATEVEVSGMMMMSEREEKSLIVMLQRIDAMYKEDATETGAGAKFAPKKKNAMVALLPAQQDSDGVDLVALPTVTSKRSERGPQMKREGCKPIHRDWSCSTRLRVSSVSAALQPKRITGRGVLHSIGVMPENATPPRDAYFFGIELEET